MAFSGNGIQRNANVVSVQGSLGLPIRRLQRWCEANEAQPSASSDVAFTDAVHALASSIDRIHKYAMMHLLLWSLLYYHFHLDHLKTSRTI